LRKGDRVLLDMIEVPDEFSVELMRAARGAAPRLLWKCVIPAFNREIVRGTNEKHANLVRDLELFRMKKVQAYIAIRGSDNCEREFRCAGRPHGDVFANYPPGAKLSGRQNKVVRCCAGRRRAWPRRRA